MAITETVYRVTTEYGVRDRASAGLSGIAKSAQRADSMSRRLKRTLVGLGAGFSIFQGARLAKSYLIDFNAQMDSLRTSLATAVSINLHTTFERGAKAANRMFRTFVQMSKKSPATTKDFVNMSNAIGGTALKMGLSLRQLEKLTKGAIIASQALAQGRSDLIAVDVRQMLSGVVTQRDQYAQILLGGIGYSKEQFNAIANERKRAQVVFKALNQPQLQAAADSFGKSYAGRLSTFKDTMQLTFGAVGKPLFHAITEELKKWNTWLEKNSAKVERMGRALGESLVDGFKIIKSVGKFFVEHADTLISIAKVWAALKVSRMAAGFTGGVLGRIGMASRKYGGMAALRTDFVKTGRAAQVVGTQFQRAAGAISRFTPHIGLAIGALGLLANKAREHNRDKKSLASTIDLLAPSALKRAEFLGRGYTDAERISDAQKRLMDLGIIGPKGKINERKLYDLAGEQYVKKYTAKGGAIYGARVPERVRSIVEAAAARATGDWLRSVGRGLAMMGRESAPGLFGLPGRLASMFAGDPKEDAARALEKPANLNVTIQKIEVPARDPDRWIRDFEGAVAARLRAPTRPRAALTGAGL